MPEPGPRMNGFSLGELCWLFCCPPCPSRIAAKLAFLPPEPTYTVLAPEQRGPGAPAPASAAAATAAAAAAAATAAAQPAPQQPEEGAGAGPGACSLHLSERADWQYSQRELDAVEVFFSRTARDNRLGCMFVRCAPSSRYTLLFSHGNAVDLGQMCSFYIGLGSRINCNIFSYDYSGYGVSSGKPSEKNLYADIDAAWQALRTRCELSKMRTSVPSPSGVSDTAACPLSPIAGNPSALPPPTSSPSSSQYLFLPVHSMPAPVCQLLYCTTVLFKGLYCQIKNVLLIFYVCFVCSICVKSVINLFQYSAI
ncbi:alpha/beta hydrolase domain-containing protein 17C isoform X3 [Hippopotamus amphibius kiboko]|uniref:alpha/beta hydrolase domain-containing protein 17C isoform X3 n=1 Tax=Hippopotamus amphibius kiboko TaxID=575201 RepID=UPI0025964766|nr:alpha/beta hydrolase domain-containing protein 17C isoform X3 [Hippopotamus amphibius kiboko]